ncbi:MAG: TonB-dependent receptor [Bacteroidia bacterium]
MFLCCATLALQAQQPGVAGRLVAARDSAALAGASVVLSNGAGWQEGRISDANGRFRFMGVAPGDYVLTVAYVGYDTLRLPVAMTERPVLLGVVVMQERSFSMDEVEIEGRRALATQLGDTTQFNADAFKTNPDATAQDLIEKLPGVVMQNGQVQSQGEQVRQVLVDGKPFFGNDPSAALNNLPAEVIEKIQVFDQQSDQSQFTGFNDGQTTKTINIITRGNMHNGTFGQMYAGYGYDNVYKAGASLNFFNGDRRITLLFQSNNINQQNFAPEDLAGVMSGGGGRRGGGGGGGGGFRPGGGAGDFLVNQQGGITTTHALGLNYADKWGEKLEVSGSYFFNYGDNTTAEKLNRIYVSAVDSGQVYAENSASTSNNINHRLNMRLEYKFSDKTSLMLRPRLTIQQNDGAETSNGATTLYDALLNASQSDFSSDLLALDFSNMLLLRHKLGKEGRTVSLNVETGFSNQNGNSLLYSSLYFQNNALSDTLDQTATLRNAGWSIRTNVEYSEPLGEKAQLQLGYSYAPQLNDSDKRTYAYQSLNESYSLLDTLLSNTFSNTYTAHQVQTGLRFRGEKLNASLRVAAQYATLAGETVFPYEGTIERSFTNVLPSAFLRYAFSKQKNLFMMYRTSTNPPTVTQLQEVIDNSNPLQLRTGNPDLKQNFDQMLMTRYFASNTEKATTFFAMLRLQYTDNYIGNSTIIAREDLALPGGLLLARGAQLTRPVNLDGYWSLRSFVNYSFPITALKSNLNLNAEAGYTRTPGLINESLNFSNAYNLAGGAVVSSNFSEKIDFTVSSRTSVNRAINTLQSALNNQYINQDSRVRLNLLLPQGIVFRSELNHQLFTGLSDGFNQNFWLWNLSLGKKLFKNQRGELAVSVFDLLHQNNSISRTVSDVYIQDLETVVLQRYVMLTFTYRLRQFNGTQQGTPPGMMPFGPGGPGGPPTPGGRP